MSIKRYVAEDMRQALKQIREELGPDAIILSNRRVEGGVEIITSADGMMPTAAVTKAARPSPRLAGNVVDRIGENRLAGNNNVTDKFSQQSIADDSFPDDSFPEDTVELSSVSAMPESVASAAVAKPAPIAKTSVNQLADKPARRTAVRQSRYIDKQLNGGAASASGQAQIDDTFEHLLGQYGQPAASTTQANANGQVMAAMRSEIESLRLLLKDQMAHTSEDRWALKNPLESAVVKRLVAEGISDSLAHELVGGLGPHDSIEDAWHAALDDLAGSVPILQGGVMNKDGVVAFLGATGVGKTTTIAKLAVRYALEHGPDQLALVTTDSYRLAAYEQLRTLGRIIDVPVRQVDEYNSLEDVLQSLKHKSMVLIDTAGFHLGDKDRLEQLKVLDGVTTPIKKLLVLPSTSQSKVLQSVYQLMAEIKLDGCVLSKVDESSSLGEVLSLVVEKQLPVAYITNGQKIPNDIEKARSDMLVQGLDRAQRVSPSQRNNPFNKIRKPAPAYAEQRAQAGII
ncbi:MAG: flagellar biosynthesis protein FlhF [Pseudomonadales bacterium]